MAGQAEEIRRLAVESCLDQLLHLFKSMHKGWQAIPAAAVYQAFQPILVARETLLGYISPFDNMWTRYLQLLPYFSTSEQTFHLVMAKLEECKSSGLDFGYE